VAVTSPAVRAQPEGGALLLRWWTSVGRELWPVALLVALALAAEWDRLSGPAWLGMDTATAFFPWYSFLGEQLRSGHIPVWNPHTFAGAPFAADPESGWMYLPAMAAFSLLALDAAVRASLLFNVLLAALSTFALARALRINHYGAVLAATVYAHSGFFEGHNVCCYAYADVAAWLPLALLGAECAMRAEAWRARLLWASVSGLALSQILAAWIGQGAYYATLVVGSYVVVRSVTQRRERWAQAAATVAILALWAGSLAAAGLLPRLEYNAVSNLPGGYPSADVSLRATTWNDWGIIANPNRLLLEPGFEYIGLPVVLLALAAIPVVLSKRRPLMLGFFAGLGLVVLLLARAEPTPLHALFSLLPGFERIHARSPERAMIAFYLAPAILSGATLSWLTCLVRRWRVAATTVGVGIVALVSLDLHQAWLAQAEQALAGQADYQFVRVDLASYLAPTPGAEFLMNKSDAEFRYFGYAGHVFGGPMPYTLRWTDPSIAALEVNNRALLTGLDDIQGYNPVHIARYDDLISGLNGSGQNYHHADVFESGFDSPLLDVLNVRYIILPSAPASDEVLPRYARSLQLVYRDDAVEILENPTALPRAWLVHAAVQSTLGEADVDLRNTAILDQPPPPLRPPDAASAEHVEILDSTPDARRFNVVATAPGLLVASEVAYPAWRAYVDGAPSPMYVVDGALRGIPVSEGTHSVEMRYESAALAAGLALTLTAAALLAGLAILHCASALLLKLRSRDESGEVRCKSGAVPQL
jgi:hypothetical protein